MELFIQNFGSTLPLFTYFLGARKIDTQDKISVYLHIHFHFDAEHFTMYNFGLENIDLLRWLLFFNLLYPKIKKSCCEFETKPSNEVKILCAQFSVNKFIEGRKKTYLFFLKKKKQSPITKHTLEQSILNGTIHKYNHLRFSYAYLDGSTL